MKFLLILASLLVIVIALPSNLQQRNAVDDGIIAFIEKLRARMPCGFEEYGIPALAPLELEHYEFDFNFKDQISAAGSVSNVRVDGLNKFVIEKISFNLILLTLNFDFTLSELSATGEYDIKGKALQYPFSGKGKFGAKALDMQFVGSTKLALKNGFLDMSNFKSKFLLRAVESKFEGLISENGSDFINSVIEKLLPDLVKVNEQLISDTIEDLIKTNANSVLNTLSLSALLELITSGGGESPTCDIELYKR